MARSTQVPHSVTLVGVQRIMTVTVPTTVGSAAARLRWHLASGALYASVIIAELSVRLFTNPGIQHQILPHSRFCHGIAGLDIDLAINRRQCCSRWVVNARVRGTVGHTPEEAGRQRWLCRGGTHSPLCPATLAWPQLWKTAPSRHQGQLHQGR